MTPVTPCSICLQETFRCPVQICSLGHCLDIGCLLQLMRFTPADQQPLCPLDRSVIDLSKLIYREDIVYRQEKWILVSRRALMGSSFSIPIATRTQAREILPLYHNDPGGSFAEEIRKICLRFHGTSSSFFGVCFSTIVPTPEHPDCRLFPEESIARPEDHEKTLSICVHILQTAYCRSCASKIAQTNMTTEKYALVEACKKAGHTDFSLTST